MAHLGEYVEQINREQKNAVIEELEKIKEEINSEDVNCRYDEFAYSSGLQKTIELIDKHIAGIKGECDWL